MTDLPLYCSSFLRTSSLSGLTMYDCLSLLNTPSTAGFSSPDGWSVNTPLSVMPRSGEGVSPGNFSSALSSSAASLASSSGLASSAQTGDNATSNNPNSSQEIL